MCFTIIKKTDFQLIIIKNKAIVDDEGITTVASKARRRKLGEDSDDDELGVAPPVNDIYRQRQQKRVK
ncbi:unnamed protein product [Arctia plantaginis]|uniref:Uncharacterized protein n=1 Tax=Arctia plantaginis TaxID=874455 RepID=A0A8S0ZLG6_ARCPL|nr:unnamed protein product [Arctia plantaginis]